MNTDTVFQIIDRAAIARLKEFHYRSGGREQEADLAADEAANLEIAGDVLLWEIMNGKIQYPVHFHLRYHNHSDVEDVEDNDSPKTVFQISSALSSVHAEYWQLQSKVNSLKSSMNKGVGIIDELNSEFVSLQRKIDLCNQRRNELIQKGDEVLRDFVNGSKCVLNK